MKVAYIRQHASLSDAFASARAAKCDEFIWRGKSFHTKLAEEVVERWFNFIERIEYK